MKSLSESPGPITDINVTPLVDIILVVLIIFMATAPLIHRRAIKVDVPEAKHQERAEVEVLEVTFNKTRELYVEGRAVSRRELSDSLKALFEATPDMRVLVSADEMIPYGEIIGLLDLIRGTGLRRVSLEVKSG